MELAIQDFRQEEIYITGGFGLVEHFSKPMKVLSDHLIANLEHRVYLFGKQLQILHLLKKSTINLINFYLMKSIDLNLKN
jgi:hypothetical protein